MVVVYSTPFTHTEMSPPLWFSSNSIASVIFSVSPTNIVALSSFIVISEANLYTLNALVPLCTVVLVPLISLYIATTS